MINGSFVFARLTIDIFLERISGLTCDPCFPGVQNTSVQGNEHFRSEFNLASQGDVFVWAIMDKSPPAKSGVVTSHSELVEIATDNGISGFANQYQLDEFAGLVNCDYILISHMKRPNDLYSVCVWKNTLEYLCDIPPFLLQENITKDKLTEILLTYGGEWSGMWKGGYIRNYIRRREAKRKLLTQKTGEFSPVFVEFVYSPENTWFIQRNRWVWLRHRIVKKTSKTIFVEEQSYHGSSFLKSGWQAFIVYTVMIDRQTFETEHEFTHHSRRKTFYDIGGAPEVKSKRFVGFQNDLDNEFDTDDVIELPINGVQWALNILKIDKWPTTKEAIKKAYNTLSIRFHPDKEGGSHQSMVLLNRAKDFLISEVKL